MRYPFSQQITVEGNKPSDHRLFVQGFALSASNTEMT